MVGDIWGINGGLETLENYRRNRKKMTIPDDELFHRHVRFLSTLDYYYEIDDYIFVHAGIEPGVKPDETDPWTLMWIRDDFVGNYDGEKTAIFGHTPTRFLKRNKSNDVYFGKNNVIGIDGGAVYGCELSWFDLQSK